MTLRRGASLEVTVEKGVYRGLGLARHEGQVVFVPRGVAGDRLRVRVESVSRGYVRAGVEEVIEAGRDRRASPCPYVPLCGGCSYQDLDYPAQLRLKQEILRESLERAGAAWRGELPIVGSPEQGWRMRARFHVQVEGGVVRLGLREEGSHRVVDLPRCLQVSASMNRALRGLRDAIDARLGLAQRIADIELAESADGDRLVACVETDLDAAGAAGLSFLADASPWLSGFGVAAGAGSRQYLSLRGDPYVEANVLGYRLRSHVLSFFQANRFLVEDLVKAVAEKTPRGGALLDLYAGVGLFSIPLASRAESVLAVEVDPLAVADAEANVRTSDQHNVRVWSGDVQQALAATPVAPHERVILDPPRSGVGPDLIQAIATRRPAAVVYVSCDPPTLGRDLKTFSGVGYEVRSVQALDQFPDTFHLETVVQLTPAS